MKIAILSDIHGNIDAFKAVIDQMKKQKVDIVFSLGDHLGYYPEAIEVFDEIKKWDCHVISGNHERIFLNFLKESKEYRENVIAKYGTSYLHYEKSFSDDLITEISQFPDNKEVVVDGIKFLLCHGSPMDKDQYIYPDAENVVLDDCDSKNCDFVFMGHTHYPMVYKGENTMIVNVGSIGQARTIGGIANWGIVNTKNKVYTPLSTPYDISKLEERLKKNKEREYLYKILRRNNSTL
ncbi:metallophosphoesterase family protein [Aquimarina sp. MMG015]|uniref:metallophosphoesterase family protein n=1 Tax=Aquimarina sp. MMG015 TaxID=2822689 RepID=UPI001B3A0324|nr:metallophosphoesterase family protein [Aquimarina sp. MMG015]MBQ4801417.1 metallophosphoesterase family protein [Aquimarina sp. MMG015]